MKFHSDMTFLKLSFPRPTYISVSTPIVSDLISVKYIIPGCLPPPYLTEVTYSSFPRAEFGIRRVWLKTVEGGLLCARVRASPLCTESWHLCVVGTFDLSGVVLSHYVTVTVLHETPPSYQEVHDVKSTIIMVPEHRRRSRPQQIRIHASSRPVNYHSDRIVPLESGQQLHQWQRMLGSPSSELTSNAKDFSRQRGDRVALRKAALHPSRDSIPDCYTRLPVDQRDPAAATTSSTDLASSTVSIHASKSSAAVALIRASTLSGKGPKRRCNI